MAGAAVPIGAVASIGGLTQFLSGLEAVGDRFGRVADRSDEMIRPLRDATLGFRAFNDVSSSLGKSLDQVADAFGTLTTPVTATAGAVGSAISGLADISEEAGSRTVTALAGVGVAATSLGVGGTAGLSAFGASLTAAFGAALAVTARFQREVVDLAAITQEAPAAVNDLTDSVKGLARQFATSIPDIQSAGLELARAGIPVAAVSDGALELTLALEQLSKGEISAGKAAEGLASIYTVFQTQFEAANQSVVEGATRVANSITAIANATRAGIPELITAFAKVGPVAQGMGESVETTAASLGLLLKAGLQGEEAGTALRNFFIRMQNPASESRAIMNDFGISMFDADGNARSFSVVLGDLIELFSPAAREINGITDEVANWALAEIFQTRALTATKLAMVQGTEAYEEFLAEIARTDVLAQAATQMEALLRQISRFRNIVELAGIAFGTNFVAGLSAATRSVNDFLVEGERLERMTNAIGVGVRGLFTGQGEVGGPEANVVEMQFGPDAAQAFSNLVEQSQRVLASIGETLGAAGRLKDTLLQVAFPEGIDDIVQRLANVFIQVNLGAQAFLGFLSQIAPSVANGLGNAVQGVLEFGRRLKDVVVGGLDAQQVAGIFSQIGDTAQRIAGIVGDVILAIGRFVRAVIDNTGPILGALEGVARAIGFITIQFINAGTTAVQVFGAIARAADAAHRLATRGIIANPEQQERIRQGLQTDPNKPLFIVAPPETPAEITQIDQALDQLGRSFGSSQEDAQAFFGTLDLGQGVLRDLFDSFTTGRSVIQLQTEALEDLQDVLSRQMTEGPAALRELSGFLGERIPQDIKNAIAELAQLDARMDQTFDEADLERAGQLIDFIAARAGAAHAELAGAARVAPAVPDRPEAGGPGSFDPGAAKREAEQAARALAAARNRLTEAREDAIKNATQAERALGNAMESIQQRWIDGAASLVSAYRDAMANIKRDAERAAKQAIDAFNKTQERQAEDVVRGRSEEDARQEFQRGLEDRQRFRQQSAEIEELAASRIATRLETIERRHQDEVTRIRQQGIDRANTVFQRGQEDQLRSLTEANERATQALTRQFDETNLTRGRGREDAQRGRDLARDLAKAKTEEERKELQTRFQEESQTLASRRQDEDAERVIRRQQEAALAALRKSQEVATLQFRRSQEDEATNRRRQQETADIAFRQQQEDRFVQFRENLENEARVRRRIADAAELAARQRDEQESLKFTRDQQDARQREVTRPRAEADLAEQLAGIDERRAERELEARETLNRGIERSTATLDRELASAFRTHAEALERINARMLDLMSDLVRQSPDVAGEATATRVAVEAELAALAGIARGTVAAVKEPFAEFSRGEEATLGSVLEAIREIQATPIRLTVEDEQTSGLFSDLRELRAGGEIVLRALVAAPQADAMIAILREIAKNTGTPAEQAPLIGEINLAPTPEAAREVGNAVASAVRFVGGNA